MNIKPIISLIFLTLIFFTGGVSADNRFYRLSYTITTHISAESKNIRTINYSTLPNTLVQHPIWNANENFDDQLSVVVNEVDEQVTVDSAFVLDGKSFAPVITLRLGEKGKVDLGDTTFELVVDRGLSQKTLK